ncbi:MAG: type II toxin-antitoxin system RelE/ParE family toxin [Tannerellaceae bacterium]|nr:type II toxin-antitoxin system RelE/ParE family toxin [Tannerellaceae bacterium]
MNVEWLPLALQHLDDIYNYYSQYSQTTAKNIGNQIIQNAGMCETFPKIGKIEPLLKTFLPTFRSLVSYQGRYKIIYYKKEDYIYIATIWDCRQNPSKLSQTIR